MHKVGTHTLCGTFFRQNFSAKDEAGIIGLNMVHVVMVCMAQLHVRIHMHYKKSRMSLVYEMDVDITTLLGRMECPTLHC